MEQFSESLCKYAENVIVIVSREFGVPSVSSNRVDTVWNVRLFCNSDRKRGHYGDRNIVEIA